mgnify:CR=1 FL=1
MVPVCVTVMPVYDVRYNEYPLCPKCGQRWQLIDWACALHRLSCGAIEVPEKEKALIVSRALERGQVVYWR